MAFPPHAGIATKACAVLGWQEACTPARSGRESVHCLLPHPPGRRWIRSNVGCWRQAGRCRAQINRGVEPAPVCRWLLSAALHSCLALLCSLCASFVYLAAADTYVPDPSVPLVSLPHAGGAVAGAGGTRGDAAARGRLRPTWETLGSLRHTPRLLQQHSRLAVLTWRRAPNPRRAADRQGVGAGGGRGGEAEGAAGGRVQGAQLPFISVHLALFTVQTGSFSRRLRSAAAGSLAAGMSPLTS